MAAKIKEYTVQQMYEDPDFHDLVAEYSAECAIDGMPSPEYRMQSYLQLELAGALKAFAAFDAPNWMAPSQMVGFAVTVSPVIPHYGFTVTVLESMFVGRAWRKSRTWKMLLNAVEDHAKLKGSPGLLANAPHEGDFATVLPRIGYKPVSGAFFRKF